MIVNADKIADALDLKGGDRDLCLDLLSALHFGEPHAVHAAQIASENGWNAREIRRVVNIARKCGLPICSGQSGYWVAASPLELQGTCAMLTAQAKAVNDAVGGMATHWDKVKEVL